MISRVYLEKRVTNEGPSRGCIECREKRTRTRIMREGWSSMIFLMLVVFAILPSTKSMKRKTIEVKVEDAPHPHTFSGEGPESSASSEGPKQKRVKDMSQEETIEWLKRRMNDGKIPHLRRIDDLSEKTVPIIDKLTMCVDYVEMPEMIAAVEDLVDYDEKLTMIAIISKLIGKVESSAKVRIKNNQDIRLREYLKNWESNKEETFLMETSERIRLMNGQLFNKPDLKVEKLFPFNENAIGRDLHRASDQDLQQVLKNWDDFIKKAQEVVKNRPGTVEYRWLNMKILSSIYERQTSRIKRELDKRAASHQQGSSTGGSLLEIRSKPVKAVNVKTEIPDLESDDDYLFNTS